jgi:hypothetical protein
MNSDVIHHRQNSIAEVYVVVSLVFSSHTQILLTPRSKVVLEQLTDSQLVKKLPAFYGTGRFITGFARAYHLFLSRASPCYPIPHSEDPFC